MCLQLKFWFWLASQMEKQYSMPQICIQKCPFLFQKVGYCMGEGGCKRGSQLLVSLILWGLILYLLQFVLLLFYCEFYANKGFWFLFQYVKGKQIYGEWCLHIFLVLRSGSERCMGTCSPNCPAIKKGCMLGRDRDKRGKGVNIYDRLLISLLYLYFDLTFMK